MELSEEKLRSYFEIFKKAYKGKADDCEIEASPEFEQLIADKHGKKNIDVLEYDRSIKNEYGGFATVFKVINKSNNQRLVIKVQQQSEFDTIEFIKQTVQNEKQALEDCKGPNTMPLYCYAMLNISNGETSYPVYFLIFPNYSRSSFDYLTNPNRTTDQYISYTRDICVALKAVADNGYIHGDVRASNLFAKRNDDGKYIGILGDFGIATKDCTTLEYRETIDDEYLGIDYPPENGNPDLMNDNFTFDLYTLARTIETINENRDIIFDSNKITPKFQAVLDKMTADKIGDRYQNPDEVIQELDKLLNPSLAKAKDKEPIASAEEPNEPSSTKIEHKDDRIDSVKKQIQSNSSSDSGKEQNEEPTKKEPPTKENQIIVPEPKKPFDENATPQEIVDACKEILLDFKSNGKTMDEAYQEALKLVGNDFENESFVRISTYITVCLYLLAKDKHFEEGEIVKRKEAFLKYANLLKSFAQSNPSPETQYFYAYLSIKFGELDFDGNPYDEIKNAADRGCVLAKIKYGQFCIDSQNGIYMDYQTGLEYLKQAYDLGHQYAKIYISDFVKSKMGLAGDLLKPYEEFIENNADDKRFKTKRYWIVKFI